jgi:hypothetical protein
MDAYSGSLMPKKHSLFRRIISLFRRKFSLFDCVGNSNLVDSVDLAAPTVHLRPTGDTGLHAMAGGVAIHDVLEELSRRPRRDGVWKEKPRFEGR